MGSESQHTQKDACLVLSSEFAFALIEGRQRATDRLAELRDGSIGSFALAIRSAQILAVFGDAKRDIDRGGLRGSG